MRIGIDCRAIGEPAGIGTYVRELLASLLAVDGHNHYALFFYDDFADAAEFKKNNSEIILLPKRSCKKFLPIIYSHFLVARTINQAKLDVCFFPANVMPLLYRGRAVLTIHDLAVYIRPELFPARRFNFDRRVVVPRSIKRADRIIAVSQSTKRDIMELFPVVEEKIKVVYEGAVKSVLVAADSEIPAQPYFLFVGTIEPRKNLQRLVEAFASFVKINDWPGELILAGGSGWKNKEIFEAISLANTELKRETIRYVGYVSEAEKGRLMAQALAFVYPSLYEGFGLPVIEALSLSLPVITSNATSLPEIADGAALLVDPLSMEEIAQALSDIASDEQMRHRLSAAGKIKAQAFTWDKCAKETLDVLESV